MSFVRFASLNEVQPGQRKSLRLGMRRIVVFNVAGSLFAIEDACAHMKAPLSGGRLRGTELTCSWHGWVYDITSGRRTGRDHGCVRTYPTRIEAGDIFVDPAENGSLGMDDPEDPDVDGGAAEDDLPPPA